MITNIIRHEIRSVLANPKSWYTFAAVFAVFAIIFNWLMNLYLQDQLLDSKQIVGVTEAVIHPFYAWFGLFSIVIIPNITTQYICGEKNRGTLINYYFSNVTATQLFYAKLFTLGLILATVLGAISLIPLTITLSASLDLGQLFSSILGVYLMLLVAIAFGLCLATFMQHTLRASIIILCSLGAFIMLEWAAQLSKSHVFFVQQFALLKPLKSFLSGLVTPGYVSYYILVILACSIIGSWRLEAGKFYD